MCPPVALRMGWHLAVLLVIIPLTFPLSTVRTALLQKLPRESPLRTAEAQRRYRYRNALASSPNAYPPLSREKMFHRKRRAEVRARRDALPCPPTTDL